MKKYILFAFLITTTIQVSAFAEVDSIPAHLKHLLMPDFKLLLADGKTNFYSDKLSKKKKTIIINFSPECEHCRLQTEELIQHIDEIKGTQIVMSTALPIEKLKLFYDEFEIAKYPNIIMGQDVLFFFSRYYRNQFLPGIAVYNKKRALLDFYDGGAKTEELIKLVNK